MRSEEFDQVRSDKTQQRTKWSALIFQGTKEQVTDRNQKYALSLYYSTLSRVTNNENDAYKQEFPEDQ